jgi:hypothetical protein
LGLDAAAAAGCCAVLGGFAAFAAFGCGTAFKTGCNTQYATAALMSKRSEDFKRLD